MELLRQSLNILNTSNVSAFVLIVRQKEWDRCPLSSIRSQYKTLACKAKKCKDKRKIFEQSTAVNAALGATCL